VERKGRASSKKKIMPWDPYVEEAAANFGFTKAHIAKLRKRTEEAVLDELAQRIAERAAHGWTPGGR
jgi:hypothetical protein